MSWLDALLGRESHDRHEYVRCGTCNGSGLQGENRWCPACGGKGYRLVGKPGVHDLHVSGKTRDRLLDALATMLAWGVCVIPIAALFLIRLTAWHDAWTYPTPIFKSDTLGGVGLVVGLVASAIGLGVFFVWLSTPKDDTLRKRRRIR
jgi:hypothetical protein